jgi:hypothetical protein
MVGTLLKGHSQAGLVQLEVRLRNDVETYYLSPSGHQLWRGGLPYNQFPFRKIVSILSWVRKRG